MYSPERDFAYQYPALIKHIRRNFNLNLWPELMAVVEAGMEASGIENPDVFTEMDKANIAYSRFTEICCENPKESVTDCLIRSGFKDVHPAAQFGWMAMMGAVMTGQLFIGLRDITYSDAGVSSRPSLTEMSEGSDEVVTCLNTAEETLVNNDPADGCGDEHC